MRTTTGSGPDPLDPWSEHERARVTRLCAVISGDPAAAEDLAQETLLQAWRIRDRLVDASGHRSWVDAVARHVCTRWRVSRGRLAAHELSSDTPEQHPTASAGTEDPIEDLLEREELAELLDRALALLPADTREALVARYVDEVGPGEIARRAGVSPDAVSMRLTRGRARLRELLESELADEPLAQVWIGRHGTAWRPTRMACSRCGHPTTSMRRDRGAGALQLRCDACDPDGLASSWRLDNPTLSPQLEAVRRPTAVVARMAAWAQGFWLPAVESGRARCTRCAATCVVAPYERADTDDPNVRRGWQASCAACGEELTTSFLGLALTFPESRELCRRRPRAHAVPAREVTVDGRPFVLVSLRDDASGERVEMLYDDATSRLHGLVASV